MSIKGRIAIWEARQMSANRKARQEWFERAYSQGYRGLEPSRPLSKSEVFDAAVCCFAVFGALAWYWLL